MMWTNLFNQAYLLCLQTGRNEIIPELAFMDVATLSGLIAWLSQLLEI